MKIFVRILLLQLLPFVLAAQDAETIAKKKPTRLVNDFAGVLTPDQLQNLENKLVAYDDSTSTQIAVAIIPSLGDLPIEEAALQIFRGWGVGNAKTNNGILILSAINDRKIRIEVGYGLEGVIPDITANQIIRNDIVPSFRKGNYYEGLDGACNSIILAAAGEYQAPEGYHEKEDGGNIIGLIVLFIIILIIVSNINRRGGGGFMSRRGYHGFGPPIWGPTIFGSGSRGGGWGSGGGFGGFGGGSSGGGGASGSW
jgi:uncharacterized protein